MKIIIQKLNPFGLLITPREKETSIESLEIEELKKFFNKEYLLLLRGFKTFHNSEHFSLYCESWGEVSLWPFGKVLELIEQDNPQDHIFANSAIPLHWDGMFREQIPEYQIFHCKKAPSTQDGGKTTFSNTVSALSNMTNEFRGKCENITGIYQREMEFYHSKVTSPIICKHPYKDFSVIRYNEPHFDRNGEFINPSLFQFIGIDKKELKNFQVKIKESLYSSQNFYSHEWKDGDVVIADNFSLLHGREEFTSKSSRHLQRVQVLSNPPFNNPNLESYR